MTEPKKDNYDNPLSATLSGITNLFRKHQAAGELKPGDRFDGKTVLVDGASSGLGFAIATDCARRGARVIMACRSGIPGKGEQVKKITGNPEVHMLPVDFADVDSVRKLAAEVKARFSPIDIFISNAGVVPKKSRKTPQGLEEMFMVNYFSKFILVNLLLQADCFRTSDGRIPRIVFVDSETHRNPKRFEWDKFGIYEPYTIGKSMEHYGYNKMLLATFSVELSRRLNQGEGKATAFSVFTLCPGPINSNIGREAPKIFHPLMKLIFSIFFRSPAKAAVPVIYLAASRDMEGKPFDYFFLMSRKPIDEKSADPENGKRLWELSMKLARELKAVE
jgi:NAD(P)-dependent dehydrogenase (short-subunit alcohol dehydrogenase family)